MASLTAALDPFGLDISFAEQPRDRKLPKIGASPRNDQSLWSNQPEEAVQQFTTGPERQFTQQFANSFLDAWSRELSGTGTTPQVYSVALLRPIPAICCLNGNGNGNDNNPMPRVAMSNRRLLPHPEEDLRVFIR